MRIFLLMAAVLAALAGAFPPHSSAQAGRGVPGSPEFGYGARIELDGIYLDQALELAADLRFDWLVVPVRWSAVGLRQATQSVRERSASPSCASVRPFRCVACNAPSAYCASWLASSPAASPPSPSHTA